MRLTGYLILCLCLALAGGARSVEAALPEEELLEEVPQLYSGTAELRPLVPDNPPTHEEIAQGMRGLIAGAQDSCAKMLEEAEARGGEAVEIAEAARAEHEPRLAELAGLDYDAMPDAEIYQYMAEVSGIITAFREARDAIGELS